MQPFIPQNYIIITVLIIINIRYKHCSTCTLISRHNTCNSDTIVYEKLLQLLRFSSSIHLTASRREKVKAQKKEYKLFTKLSEQEEQCKEKMAACETRDVRARQVPLSPPSPSLSLSPSLPLSLPLSLSLSLSLSRYLLTLLCIYTVCACVFSASVMYKHIVV